jgi:nitroreductase / dihydropteridine reductase
MNMDIARAARRRHSCKAFDAQKKIPPELVGQLRQVLRWSPSSTNSQPWHFVIAATAEGKARVAEAATGLFAYNAPKIVNASHVVVLCARRDMEPEHLEALLAQEQADGRFDSEEARARQGQVRGFYVDHHRQAGTLVAWMQKQVYLALGGLLLGAAALEIDACPVEGFDAAVLDEVLGLAARGLAAQAIVALGYRSPEDFNAAAPKSRLPEAAIFTDI